MPKTLTIEIYRPIGVGVDPDTGTPMISADEIASRLSYAGAIEEIELLLNSPGGDLKEAVAIFNLLREHASQKIAKVYGQALSAVSLIAMACDRIVMYPGSMMMIHEVSTEIYGTADDLDKRSELVRQLNSNVAEIYTRCNRKGKKIGEIEKWMKEETWMSPQQCLDNGFCDELSQEAPMKVAALAIPSRFGYKQAHVYMQQHPRQNAGEIQSTEVQEMHEKTKQFLAELFKALGFSGDYDPEKFDHAAALQKVNGVMAAPKEILPEAAMKALDLPLTAKPAEFIGAVMAMKHRGDVVPLATHAALVAENKVLKRDALLMRAVHVEQKLTAAQVAEGSEFYTLADTNPEAFNAALIRLPKFEMRSNVAIPGQPAGTEGTAGTTPSGDEAEYLMSIKDSELAVARYKAADAATKAAYVAAFKKRQAKNFTI